MSEVNQTVANQIVIFTLDGLNYALPLTSVIRIIHAVEIRYLPKAPEIISGIINVRGQIIPVIDIRKRFGIAEREIAPEDHILIADTGKRMVAVPADTVSGIKDLLPGEELHAGESLQFAEYLRGVIKSENGLTLIYNLDKFLSLDEDKELEKALKVRKE